MKRLVCSLLIVASACSKGGASDAHSTGGAAGQGAGGAAAGAAGTAGIGGNPGIGDISSGVSTRLDRNFDLDWKYQKGDLSGAEASAFDDASWAYVDLPHSTEWVSPETPNAYRGVSWYRKHFSLDSAYHGSKVVIEFEAAMQAADVWVNGVHEIRHNGGYAPFTVDITRDALYGDADNVIAVKLDSSANAAWAPGQDGVDFQYHGGLYRNVKLHVMNPLHVSDAVAANQPAGGGVFVTYPAVSESSADIAVATNVSNEATAAEDTTVLSEVVDAAGQVVGTSSSSALIAPGTDANYNQIITVQNPNLWHPNTPNLYTLNTTVQVAGQALDQYSTRIGIRRIEWRHTGGLIINGAPTLALGANLHQETYGLGNAQPDQAIYYEIKRLKEGGSNFIRGSHYPHSPAFYDACDKLGVVVLNAQTGWQQYNDTPAFNAATYQELRDMIRRDRNHPSVVAWEASLNESNYSEAWALAAHGIVHEEYPGDQAYSAQWMWAHADILIGSSQAGIRDHGGARPIIIDEYGDWDYGGASSTSRQAREAGDRAMLIQASNVEDATNKNFAVSWFGAGAYWDYADYGGFGNYGITRCGFVDMYRLPKFAYFFQQSQRDPALIQAGIDSGPMVYIANQWTAASPTTVRVYSNCEQVSLYLDDALIATQAPDAGSSLPHPPFNFALASFTPGTLRADCLIGGTVEASFSRTTPSTAVAIRLRPEATTLLADASDARLVFVEVIDKNGSVVPSDATAVALTVSGEGSLLGPASITMKGGQLATWVRGTRSAGSMILTATAPGLTDASAAFETEAVPNLPPVPSDR